MRIRQGESVVILDPSQVFRPEEPYKEYNDIIISRTEKSEKDFRNYDANLQTDQVCQTYTLMHENQTMDSVKEKKEKWCSLNTGKMTILEAVHLLDELIDESDPDTDLPNSVHAFQTAERIRADHPDEDWFHLTGLLHDLGKIMAMWGEPQYFVVGDTFPLGCKFSEHIVTKYGIYKPNCGLDNVTMSWGHDGTIFFISIHSSSFNKEHDLNRPCVKSTCTKFLLEITPSFQKRYHSFYPWHCSGDYTYLCNDEDMDMLKWVKEFNKYDLYSKSDALPDVESVTPYYERLIKKYCPGELNW
ncbi:Inositol oxygenase [Acropora cervicornis]|uniref:Inositol oxygenase n=1 Tax=Acropora cervicornis TaxID=6130 RepID=A0AAD9UU55_ACRCE|nr:Inositol oxygenase [Acropora cervicornis]